MLEGNCKLKRKSEWLTTPSYVLISHSHIPTISLPWQWWFLPIAAAKPSLQFSQHKQNPRYTVPAPYTTPTDLTSRPRNTTIDHLAIPVQKSEIKPHRDPSLRFYVLIIQTCTLCSLSLGKLQLLPPWYLKQQFSNCGPRISNISISWELVTNADSHAPPNLLSQWLRWCEQESV